MARLLLIRHAPTPETGKKLTGRLSGVSLGAAGLDIARRTAESLSAVKLAAVYASPIERTWETAAAIAEPHGLEVTRHDGLLEVDYGDWSGRTLASLSKLKAWRVVQTTPSRMVFPNGEALVAAQARAVEACEALAAAHRKATIALVTHADVIKAVISHYIGQPLDLFQRVGVTPASVSVIDLPQGGPPMVVATNTNGDPTTWR
jgi:probable phosphomutase (TIGR03848 family)